MRLPPAILRRLIRLAERRMARPPDMVIGGSDAPYLFRWWLLPKNRLVNAYLHLFLRSDDPRALHDHPWANLSILLRGGYREIVTGRPPVMRAAGDVVARRAAALHRIELPAAGPSGRPAPCLSLFLTGPKQRDWGFQCPTGWRPWRRFVDPDDPGRVGPGCG